MERPGGRSFFLKKIFPDDRKRAILGKDFLSKGLEGSWYEKNRILLASSIYGLAVYGATGRCTHSNRRACSRGSARTRSSACARSSAGSRSGTGP